MRVMLIEDSLVQREALADLLTMDGHEVSAFEDKYAATACLEAGYRPDKVILDYYLEGDAPALDWLLRFRELPGCECVPVMILTGVSQADGDQIRQEVETLGPVRVVHKPADVMTIRGMVRDRARQLEANRKFLGENP